MPPAEGAPIHNRLSHSLKVAQVARATATRLRTGMPDIDPLVAEAAALAHDLGHPPFGHAAERELDKLARKAGLDDGFEGNAQSFRIVTVLAARDARSPGLDLCRATLDAILKYPWVWEEGERKWGAYLSEQSDFDFARHSLSGRERSPEAEIMDWADDVTYAVHDLEDFFKAGLIPLDRFIGREGVGDRESFVMGASVRREADPEWEGHIIGQERLLAALERLLVDAAPAIDQPFRGTHLERARLRSFTSSLIGRYINGGLTVENERLRREPDLADEVVILKEMTWHHVIRDPRLAQRQRGHRQIIKTLFDFYSDQVTEAPPGVPPGYLEPLRRAETDQERTRVAVDIVAGLSEAHAVRVHRQLTGVGLDPLADALL